MQCSHWETIYKTTYFVTENSQVMKDKKGLKNSFKINKSWHHVTLGQEQGSSCHERTETTWWLTEFWTALTKAGFEAGAGQMGSLSFRKWCGGWEGLVVNNTFCFLQRPRFLFPAAHGGSWPSVTPVPEDPLLFFGLYRPQAQTCYTYMQANIYTHKIKINNQSLKNNFSTYNLKGIIPDIFFVIVCVRETSGGQKTTFRDWFFLLLWVWGIQLRLLGLEAFLLCPSPCLPSESILNLKITPLMMEGNWDLLTTQLPAMGNWLYRCHTYTPVCSLDICPPCLTFSNDIIGTYPTAAIWGGNQPIIGPHVKLR